MHVYNIYIVFTFSKRVRIFLNISIAVPARGTMDAPKTRMQFEK